MSKDPWIVNLLAVCNRYNISHEYIAEIIHDPKVIPMIRGKSFEFFAKDFIQNILPDTYDVSEPKMNAQSNEHDVDIKIVMPMPSGAIARIECKLAGKGMYTRISEKNHKRISKIYYGACFSFGDSILGVKCMRSRTLGATRVAAIAPKLGINEEVLGVHNDQYRETDFDFVVTTIDNIFYKTDEKGLYVYSPDEQESQFLNQLKVKDSKEAYAKLYIAKSSNLIIKPENGIICTRKKCETKERCEFIPNYPMIHFKQDRTRPEHPWYPIEDIQHILDDL